MSNSAEEGSEPASYLAELFSSPLNLALIGLCGILLYKILRERFQKPDEPPPREPELPPLKKRDWTNEEILKYDGRGADGRILVAVNGKVFDMTRGKRFYGPDGPYSVFAGKDATRALATFSLTEDIKEGYDDISDLTTSQMDSVREWEEQFMEKYVYVGKLLKPGDKPTEYTDTEDETNTSKTDDRSDQRSKHD